jgi:signal transduction histidine kinase
MSTHTDLDVLLRTEQELAAVLEGLADTARRLCGARRASFDSSLRHGDVVREDGAASYLSVPVRAPTGHVLGALVLSDTRVAAFDARDEELAVVLAEQAAHAIEHTRRLDHLRQSLRSEELRAQLSEDIVRLMSSDLPLASKLERTVRALVEQLDVDFARVWTVDAQSGELVAQAGAGEHEPPTHDEEQLLRLVRSRAPGNPPQLSDVAAGAAFAGFPLVAGDATVGVLALFTEDPLPAATLALVSSFADQLGAAIERERTDAEGTRVRHLFLGMLAHDLRNPLSAFSTGSQALALMGDLDDFSRRTVDRMQRSALRMSRMVTQLTDFASAQTEDGIPLTRVPGDLHAIVRDVVDELGDAHPGRPVTLEITGSGLGEWDADRLAAVFSTLVGNALDHGARDPSAGVTVVLADRGDAIAATVHGTGPPIPADVLPAIFDPWRHNGRPRTQATSALGLGLYVSRAIVAAHGGRFDLASSAAEGTTVRMVLPRRA